jgi:hypothetical protein
MRLSVPKQAYPGLAALISLIKNSREQFVSVLDTEPANLSELQAEVAKTCGTSIDLARKAVEGIYNLHNLRRRLNTNPELLVSLLINSLGESKEEEWKAQYLDQISSESQLLATLLRPDSPVGLLEKAEYLKTEQAKIYQQGHLITDIRPVFKDDAGDIWRCIVMHRLVIEYFEAGETRSVEFSLDNTDISKLRAQCERALTKAETAKTKIETHICRTEVVEEQE